MDYLVIVVSLFAGFHGYTYAKWLKENGNMTGAAGVIVLVLINLILPVVRLLRMP